MTSADTKVTTMTHSQSTCYACSATATRVVMRGQLVRFTCASHFFTAIDNKKSERI